MNAGNLGAWDFPLMNDTHRCRRDLNHDIITCTFTDGPHAVTQAPLGTSYLLSLEL